MKRIALAALVILAAAPLAAAQDAPRERVGPPRAERFARRHPKLAAKRDAWRQLSPEQKEAKRREILERHPKLAEEIAKWKALTPEQRRARVEERKAKVLAERPKVAELLRSHPELQKLADEHPGVALWAARRPLLAKRFAEWIERHPGEAAELRAKLESRRKERREF
ncbi:MAG TPA: hypothetical protein VKE69_06270 [Planctomycetota bacterium]|nr:hypothetical protein [Planctomycetota bacterium]